MKVQASVSELTEPPTVRLSLVHPKHLAICGEFEEPPAILVSFVYYGPFRKNRAGLRFRDWMMDSGAHSAFRSGKKIDLGEYIELCLELQRTDPQLAEIITLDVIGGDWEQGLRNAREMWRRGVRAMHTYHFGEPVRVLEEALEHGKICIGGAANVHGRAKFEQARRIFDRAWPARIHGLSFFAEDQVMALPWHSVDGSSWHQEPQGYGRWKTLGGARVPTSAGRETRNVRSCVERALRIERQARAKWRGVWSEFRREERRP